MNDLENLGERLTELRKNRGWTQQQMAEKLCIARSTYAYYETGGHAPSIEMLLRICRLLQVSVGQVLG